MIDTGIAGNNVLFMAKKEAVMKSIKKRSSQNRMCCCGFGKIRRITAESVSQQVLFKRRINVLK